MTFDIFADAVWPVAAAVALRKYREKGVVY